LNNILLIGNEDVTNQIQDLGPWMYYISQDPEAKAAIDLMAVHNYAADATTPKSPAVKKWENLAKMSTITLGNKRVWMTESGHGGKNDAAAGFAGSKGVYNGIKYGNVTGWNWYYTIDNIMDNQGKLYHTGYYYKQYSRFIRPGAVHVKSTSTNDGVGILAFYHPILKSYTYVVINNTGSVQTIKINGSGLPNTYKVFQTSATNKCKSLADYTLNTSLSVPVNSLTTFVNGQYKGTKEGAVSIKRNTKRVNLQTSVIKNKRNDHFLLNGK